jgi:hypothetical protein
MERTRRTLKQKTASRTTDDFLNIDSSCFEWFELVYRSLPATLRVKMTGWIYAAIDSYHVTLTPNWPWRGMSVCPFDLFTWPK